MRFDLVLHWVVALIFIMPCLEARAEATYLSCSGTVRMIRDDIFSPEEPWIFSLSLDLERKTIIVDDYETVSLVGDPSRTGLSAGVARPASPHALRCTGCAKPHVVGGLRLDAAPISSPASAGTRPYARFLATRPPPIRSAWRGRGLRL